MTIRPATPEERDNCVQLYRSIGKAMDGYDVDAIMNTLCFMVAEIGTDLDMSKQEFIASVVNQLSNAYDTCYLGKCEPEGEA